jgi:hypothetical protein
MLRKQAPADPFDFIQGSCDLAAPVRTSRQERPFPSLASFRRLGGNGFVGENPNPDFSATFDVPHHGDTGGFYLLVGQLSGLQSLQPDVAENNRTATHSHAFDPVLLLLSEFNFFGTQHY